MPPTEVASPSSSSSHHPPQHVYLFTPGGGNPAPSLLAAGTLQRPSLQPVYPVQPPPHKTTAPFYSAGGGGAHLPGVQPHVRYVCQVGYQMAGPSDTPDPGQVATTPSHGGPQFSCYPSSADVCQVMAFPPHQMTIHSVETYPPPPAPPHLPPDQHGYLPQPPPPPPPQMVPCMYVPQYGADSTARKVPNQQILYVPASSSSYYAVDGTPVQSAPNQGQVQVIRVNTATSPNGSSQVFYSGQQQQQPGGGSGGPGPQYVCYTYPPAETSHACSASMPLVPSYPGVPMAPAIVRPGFTYPGAIAKLQSSSSPKSSQQPTGSGAALAGYQRVARASQGGEAPTERARETSGGFVPRQHLPGPRLMPIRQPQVVYPNRAPASFSLGMVSYYSRTEVLHSDEQLHWLCSRHERVNRAFQELR